MYNQFYLVNPGETKKLSEGMVRTLYVNCLSDWRKMQEKKKKKRLIIREDNEKLVALSKCFQLLINTHCLVSLIFFSLQLQSPCCSCLAMTDNLTVCQTITSSRSAVCFSYFLRAFFSPFLEPDDLTPETQLFSQRRESFVMATEHSYNQLGVFLT